MSNNVKYVYFFGAEPSSFHDMVTCRTINRVVRPRPSHIRKKFSDDISFGSELKMAAKCPPPEIIRQLNFFIRAFKKKHVSTQKI